MAASTGDVPGRIFMSYRREDTAYPAGWLYERLASHFGRNQVFKDIDSIDLGDDFVEVITTAVGSCDVLLALIGDRWLGITDQDGRRRLDSSGDFVRVEIEAALARNVRVIPILVDGAQMPRADELPESLAKLPRRQALELSPHRFDSDTQRLLRVLDRTIAQAQELARQEAERMAARRRQVEQLQGQIRERTAARDWDGVVAASDELAALDPSAADPDGLASAAREQITRRQQAEQAAAQQRRQVEQLQGQIRERTAARDWDGVVAASDELAALDPSAADPDGLASAAREQITRRQQAEPTLVAAQQPTDDQPTDDQLTELSEALREAAGAQGLAPAGQAGEGPIVSPSTSRGGVGPGVASKAGDDSPPPVADLPGPALDEEPPAVGLRLAGHAISRRLVVIAAAVGVAAIGLVTAIIVVTTGMNSTSSANNASGTPVQTQGSVSGPSGIRRWAYTTGDQVGSDPAVAGGTVYIGSSDDKVYALDAATGHLRWAHTIGSVPGFGLAVAGGTVYIGSLDHKVYALDAATGHLRWAYTTGDAVFSSPAVTGGTVYVGSDDHKVYALDAATGHLRWAYTTGDQVDSSPAVAGGTVYVGSNDRRVYALKVAGS
jgi:PQQ-like domain/TIR domain